MRAGWEEGNTLAVSAGRLLPQPSCACFLRSAKGAFVPRNKVRNSRGLDVPVLREFLEKRKGRGCAPPDSEELPQRLGEALATAAVLRVFLEAQRARSCRETKSGIRVASTSPFCASSLRRRGHSRIRK